MIWRSSNADAAPSIFAVTLPVVTVPWAQLSLRIGMGMVGMLAACGAAIIRRWRQWPAEVLRDF